MVSRSFATLIVTFFLLLAPVAVEAGAATTTDGPTPDQVCGILDFQQFIVAYSEIPKERQLSCVKLPIRPTIDGRIIKTWKQLLASEHAKHKMIVTPKDLIKNAKACGDWWNAYDSAGLNEYGYNIQKISDREYVTHFGGATYSLKSVKFNRIGDYWRIVDIFADEE